MNCDILIKNCTLLTKDFLIKKNVSIVIDDTKIIAIAKTGKIEQKYSPTDTIEGKNKLLMPGMVDAHTHICQQLLRGKIADEYPMRWTRFLVPFESTLTPNDVYYSASLNCLEMIKAGTTSFADSGGRHMDRAADAVIESGMRATIARSTMDMGNSISSVMKESAEDCIKKTEELYHEYQGKGNGRIDIWFALRQVMTCSPKLTRMIGEKAAEYKTGIHAHLYEHRDEVSYCLANYRKRPAGFLEEMGVLGPNLLTAHNVVMSESDIALFEKHKVKAVHCPAANLTSHGFSKTPQLLRANVSIGLGTDGSSSYGASLWDEMKFLRLAMTAFWGLPAFDPVVLPCEELLKMATIGGATAIQHEDIIGTIEVGKKADMILINMDQPHLAVTNKIIPALVESAGGQDVTDSIINGKLVMKNRIVLTLDEEKIIAESKKRLCSISHRANF